MEHVSGRPMTGRKFLGIMVAAFSVIIGVNLLLAFKAVETFPALRPRTLMSQANPLTRTARRNWRLAGM